MERLGTWVTRHRLTVGLLWLFITVAGLAVAPSLAGRLHSGAHVNGPAFTANSAIEAHFGGGARSNPGVLVLGAPPPDRPSIRRG